MIQASRWPNSAPQPARPLRAGPLEIALTGQAGELRELVETNLALYDVSWRLSPQRQVRLDLQLTDRSTERMAEGRFIEAAQMLVDRIPAGLRATTTSGASLTGRFEDDCEDWVMQVPPSVTEEGRWPEVEHLLTLVLTTGWRRAGWVPLHVAAIVDGDQGTSDGGRATLVCAGSMGGKTTFTLAMVRRGWRALGDDKLLLGELEGTAMVAAIKHMLNVDPAAAAWFPELGDLSRLPEYSAWTPKRRVSLGNIWPAAPAFSAKPSQLVELIRRDGRGQTRITLLSREDTIAALLRQSVIPRDALVARPIVGALARLAQQLGGFRVEIYDDAYSDPAALDEVEAVLR